MEDNNQSYKDFLSNLPKHKASREVWDRLEASMFTVNISRLPGHQAPEGLWGRIEKTYLFRRNLYRWSIVLIIFLSLLFPGYFINDGHYQQEMDQTPARSTTSETHDKIDNHLSVISFMMSIQPQRIDHNVNNQLIPDHSLTHLEILMGTHDESSDALSYMLPIEAELKSDQALRVLPRDKADDCSPFTSGSEFMFGLSYEYHHFLQGDSYLETKQDYWHSISINGRLCFGNFYLESGVGLSLTRDETSWNYDYLQNTLINTYEYVDSIHYDPNTGETIYYTSIVEVFDSIPYTKSGTITRKNSYLRIPVLAGIYLFRKKDFSTSLSGGFIYNLLLSNTETKIDYYEPESTITSVSYQETKRMQHNFNLALRLNFEWQYKKIMFYAYPSFNYYLNHLFDGQEGSKPISAGFGAGVFFR